MTRQTYRVSGVVVNFRTKQPIAGLHVEAWDRDLVFDDLLGNTVTDAGGRFEIAFDPIHFAEWVLDRAPDVFFRIFERERLLRDTRDSVIRNLAKPALDLTIELDLPAIAPPPALDRASLIELYELSAETPAQLATRAPKLGDQLRALAVAELQSQLTSALAGASESLQQHLRALALDSLGTTESLRELLRKSLGNADLSLQREGHAAIEALAIPDRIDDLVQPELPIHKNPLAQRSLEQGAMWQLAGIAKLDDAIVAALDQRALHPGNIDHARLAALVAAGLLSEDKARALGLEANLFQWSGGKAAIMAAAKIAAARVNGRAMTQLSDLATLGRADYASIFGDAEASEQIARGIEKLFPRQTLEAQHREVEPAALSKQLDELAPILAKQPDLFRAGRRAAPDLTDIPGDREKLRASVGEADRLVNRHPGLELGVVLGAPNLTTGAKANEVARRIALVGELYRANPKIDFASLDTFSTQLAFGQITDEADRRMVLEEIRATQRLLRVTGGSPEQAYKLAEAGYHSAFAVAGQSDEMIAHTTGVPIALATEYRERARDLGTAATAVGGALIDRIRGGFKGSPVDNVPTEVDNFLHRLPDYAHYFGNQAFCQCDDCASILSPAAYYVDLMEYIAEYILQPAYGTPRPSGRPLSLYDRRRDLWNGIPLTCACTETLVPYLVIINEILEDYLYSFAHGSTRPPRVEIERDVYRRLYERGTVTAQTPNGFHQPFLLPLERLQGYLSSFSLTRATIAAAVLDETGDRALVIPQARLGLSPREYALIETAHDDVAFLRGVYLFDRADPDVIAIPASGAVPPFDAQRLLAPMSVTRQELSALIRTRYVTGSVAGGIRIQEERRDASSVQPDVERIYGLSRMSLDRMHRFVRLLRRLPWTIGELDLVLEQLGVSASDAHLPLADIAGLHAMQERLRIGVEEACALIGTIPLRAAADGAESLFARLFDVPTLAPTDTDRWAPHDSNGTFVHPAFSPDPTGTADKTRSRLLAGLKINDESLLVLLGPSGAGLELDRANLARLYQHARLAALLGLTVADLIALLHLQGTDPSRRISTVTELEARLAFVDWWRASKYSIDDLLFVTGGAVRDTASYPAATELVREVVREVKQRKLLVFADTVFGFFEGVTEEQSRAIVTANPAAFVPAEVHLFRLAPSIDLAAERLVLPASVPPTLELDLRAQLRARALPGAAPFDESVFEDLVSADTSREVFEANRRLFEPLVDSDYWLAPAFNPAATILIPPGIPVTADAARLHISQFHIGHVVRTVLAGRLGISVEKLDAILAATGFDLTSPATAEPLAVTFQTGATAAVAELLFAAAHRLSVLFRDRAFSTAAIRFIGANTGTGRSFPTLDLRAPTIADLGSLTRYRSFLGDGDRELDLLHAALLGYETTASPPGFDDDALAAAAVLLAADRGLVAAITRTVAFPGPGPADQALRALAKLRRCVELAQRLGVGGDVLAAIAAAVGNEYDELDRAANAVFATMRTAADPLEDKIRMRRRDALSDYIIRSLAPEQFHTTDDLYHWFLIDTQLEGCARTSRVVAGLSSLQLYVQRVLMRLEQTESGSTRITMSEEAAAQWEWRKNYRLWEANRRVFLFPERYLIQEVRDDKTELFEAQEAQILQQDVTDQSVLDGYARYMEGFTEIAGLQVAGAYHDTGDGRDTLHLFGVTRTDPAIHYYRAIENVHRAESSDARERRGLRWGSWERLSLPIPVRSVSPIVVHGRLHVMWIDTSTRAKSPFDGYTHTRKLVFSTKRLDGTWSQPQRIDLDIRAVVDDPIVEESEVSALWHDVLSSAGIDRERARWFLGLMKTLAHDDPSVLSYASYPVAAPGFAEPIRVAFTSQVVRKLFMPALETRSYRSTSVLHVDAKDDYRLSGPWWGRPYPTVENGELNLALWQRTRWSTDRVDRYRLKLGETRELFDGTGSLRLYRAEPLAGGIDISRGLLRSVITTRAYAQAFELSTDPVGIRLVEQRPVLAGAPISTQLSVVNGTLSDGVIDVDGDLFYLYRYPSATDQQYILKRLGTTLAQSMEETLLDRGAAGLLAIENQESLAEAALPFEFREDDLWNDAGKAIAKGIPDFTGPLGVYFREVFFHVPSLIAEHLNSQQEYAAAQRWYHYIFDPTSTAEPSDRPSDRVWRYVEFRGRTLETLREQLADAAALDAYTNDPFNPHAIARQRIDAYKRGVFIRYIENLLDWGDQLFGRDTMEMINEATLLYVMASNLLGPRPPELGDCAEPGDAAQTYDALHARMDACPTAAVAAFENLAMGSREPAPPPGSGFAIDPERIGGIGTSLLPAGVVPELQLSRALITSFGSSLLRQACVFCIPPNRDLLGLHDRVADRLFKIRNCMNLAGERRQLALFSPPIDPMMLVRAKAAGLSFQDVLDMTSGNLPPYRFAFLVAKAKEYAGTVQTMGSALAAALERKDGEELLQLRLVHQQNALAMANRMREQEIEAATASLEALSRRKASVINRRDYYQQLIDGGLSDLEETQLGLKIAGHAAKIPVPILNAAAGAVAAAPTVMGMAFSTPTAGINQGIAAAANVINAITDVTLLASDIVGTFAGYDRRAETWKQVVKSAEDDLVELDKQIAAQSIRVEISEHARKLHVQSEEQLDEILAFYRDKFPNLSLYTWLAGAVQGLYREAYQSAYTMARLAERAYRFERSGDNAPLLRGNYWDASRGGFLAGERLMADLRDLERRYMETNYRGMEIDQAFSVAQIAPESLIELRETGTCEVVLPEVYFDLAYPGQYRRRIQSARLTIPCVTGPYTNVGATLTLLESQLRMEPVLGVDQLVPVPPTRSVTIATSTAQNDAGVFRLDFRDDRYMPFEGAGAVNSRWRLTLPRNFRPFDYSAINDVILHVSYTAEYARPFADAVEAQLSAAESYLQTTPLHRALSMRQEFSSTFHRFMHVPSAGAGAPLEISEKHFPLFLQGRVLELRSASVILAVDETALDVAPTSAIRWPALTVTRDGRPTELTFARDGRFGNLPYATITADAAPLDLRHGTTTFSFAVRDAGDFAPSAPRPSDPSPLDVTKLKDVWLYLDYVIAAD